MKLDTEHPPAIITVTDLIQNYGNKRILNEVSFQLYEGEILGIFGLRGTGKTSLLHVVAGVERFVSGSVEVLGHKVGKSQGYKDRLGLVTQKRSLFQDLNVYENLDFISAIKGQGKKAIPDLIERLELEAYLKEPVKRIDIGIYQRVALACALLNDPDILILDEIIRDIDLESRTIILREVTRFLDAGHSCICAFGSIEYVPYMNRVLWLDQGVVTEYTPKEAVQAWKRLYNELFDRMAQLSGEIND